MSGAHHDLRIRRIRAAGLPPVPFTETGGDRIGGSVPADWSPWCLSVVTVETSGGLVGIGSVYSDVRLVGAVLDVLEPLYHGELALEPSRVSAKLRSHAAWLGRGGAIDHTISAIDIALWDLLGQATGQPVGRLLGGRYRDRVRPYASIMVSDPAVLPSRLQELAARGFTAFKFRAPFGISDSRDESLLRAAREAVGNDAALMADAGGSDAFWQHGYTWAVRMADMAAEYRVSWLEEPLRPDALDDYCRLRGRSGIPIAGGEALTGRQAFRPFIEAGALDIVQPDVSKVGGVSEQLRIAQSAEDHGLRYVGHGSYTAIGLAADLQLASAMPSTDLVELEVDSPFLGQLCQEPVGLDRDGMLPIPDCPGLGVTLRPGVLDGTTPAT
jgi:D-galactarolactone cycloisomerase